MGHVIAGHGGDSQDGNGACAVEVHRLFVAACQLAVKVAGITAVGRDLFHGNGDFFHGIGEVGHIGQQHEDALVFQRVRFCDGKAHIRHQQTFHNGVGCRVDEHDRTGESAVFIQRIAEEQVVVILHAHTAEDDHIHFRLHGNPSQQFVVGFPGGGEDRQFLGFDQRIEEVDHGDPGTDHLAGDDTLRRVDGRSADLNEFIFDGGTHIAGLAGTGEDPPQQVFGAGDFHGLTEEPHFVARADPAGTGKDLERDFAVGEADHLCEGGASAGGHFRQIVVSHIIGFHRDHVTRDLNDSVIDFTHGGDSPEFSRQ